MTAGSNRRFTISRRQLAFTALIALMAALIFGLLTPRASYSGDNLTVSEAHKLADAGDILLIDIRRPDEWDRTGIATSAHAIDMRDDDFLDQLTRLAGTDRNAPIALMCARGVRSARLSQALTDAGYTNIIDVPEGMLGSAAGPGWLKTGLPTRRYQETDS